MAKLLKCSDVNPKCIFEIRGDSEDEVLEKAAEHFKADHSVQNLPPDVLSKARSAIRDEAEGRTQKASST